MARRKSIIKVADKGTRTELLKSIRHKLAEAIEDCESSRDLPALCKQLREVSAELGEAANIDGKKTVLELVRAKRGKQA